MARPKGSKTIYFSKVKEARDALAAKALELFDGYHKLILDAHAAQEFDVASKGYQFLMEHLPKDEEGNTLLDPSVDNNKISQKGPTGPTIQIGIALGAGVQPAKRALPPSVEVIDVDPDE